MYTDCTYRRRYRVINEGMIVVKVWYEKNYTIYQTPHYMISLYPNEYLITEKEQVAESNSPDCMTYSHGMLRLGNMPLIGSYSKYLMDKEKQVINSYLFHLPED